MYIKDVCKECNLTKKAIVYYEQQGLVSPAVDVNGYRNYNNHDISILKEISVLRKLGLGIADIRDILISNNKRAMLSKCLYKMDLEEEKTVAKKECLEQLIDDYDIDYAINYIEEYIEKYFTIKEKLLQAFPESYGMYLCMHFGPFLDEKIDTKEKEVAYNKIIDYLDSVIEIEFPKELDDFLNRGLEYMKKEDMIKMSSEVKKAIYNIDEYLDKNKENIDKYLEIRDSDEYKKTPMYKMHQLLLQFNQQSGYYDIFIENLKILSTSYKEYYEQLQEANKIFIEKYPNK